MTYYVQPVPGREDDHREVFPCNPSCKSSIAAGFLKPGVGIRRCWAVSQNARCQAGGWAYGTRHFPSRPPHPTKEKTGTRASPQSKTFLRGFFFFFFCFFFFVLVFVSPAAVLRTTPEGGQRRTPRTKAVPEQLDRRRPLGPRQQADVCVPATRRGTWRRRSPSRTQSRSRRSRRRPRRRAGAVEQVESDGYFLRVVKGGDPAVSRPPSLS